MELTFNDDQQQLQASVSRFLQAMSPESEVRRLMATDEGYDAAVWARMANELGLQGLVIPEEFGGSGASWVELGMVLEEMGRVLYCGPYFSTVVLAATTLLESGDVEIARQVLPGIANGTTIATVALMGDEGNWQESDVALQARRSGDGFVLDGHASYVIDGLIADVIICPARTVGGITLFMVVGDATGLTKAPQKTLDLTRKLARLEFADVTATLVAHEGTGWPIMERALDLAAIGLAAEQVGGAQTVLDMAVEYAKTRVQFGQVIGAFQAIKHKCAELLVEVESARSALYYALRAASERSEEMPAVSAMVKAFCSDAYCLAAHENIQIHGGIGFTWEMPCHLYYKRAKSMELYLGEPSYHRERLAQLIGL